jgi:lipopolysaccharide transport system ATP-binding protein
VSGPSENGREIMSLRNVAVAYQRKVGRFRREPFWALKDISFDLFRGETLGVIGRNGAGKSTLLQLLAGIILPDRGTIRNDGVRATLLSLALGFKGTLSGRDNAVLSGLFLGMRRREIERCLPGIEAFAELGDFFDQPVRTYSSGMRARLGFAVAILADPDVLLIDEVLGVGDADFRRKSSEALRARIRADRTVVLVSHSSSTISRLCDRAVLVEDGCVVAEGDTAEVIERYGLKRKKK